MLILKRLLLGAATLILVETAAITPAQAFILRFESTDGKLTGNIISQNDWQPNLYNVMPSNLSITGQGWSYFGNLPLYSMQVGNQWSFTSIPGSGFGQFQLPMPNNNNLYVSNVELFNNSGLPNLWPILSRARMNPSITFFCHSDSDCLGDSGGMRLDMSFTDSPGIIHVSWVGYEGGIKVTAWNPTGTSIPITPPPTNSVPEPSSASAFLLLGSGWLLRRKLVVG